jgi:hypothetical protein
MRAPLAVLAVLSLAVTSLAAQTRVVRHGDDRLTGIDEVDVLLASAPAAACAVASAPVQQRALRALREAGIRATISQSARSWHYSVVIDLRGQAAPGGCATAVVTELVAEVRGIPEADTRLSPGQWGSLLVGYMPLLRDTSLVIGPAVEHDAAVQDTVFAHVAAMAARIRGVNP